MPCRTTSLEFFNKLLRRKISARESSIEPLATSGENILKRKAPALTGASFLHVELLRFGLVFLWCGLLAGLGQVFFIHLGLVPMQHKGRVGIVGFQRAGETHRVALFQFRRLRLV